MKTSREGANNKGYRLCIHKEVLFVKSFFYGIALLVEK